MNDPSFYMVMILFPIVSMIICYALNLGLKSKKWVVFGICVLLTINHLIHLKYFNPETVDNRYGMGYVLPGLTVDIPFFILICVLVILRVNQWLSK